MLPKAYWSPRGFACARWSSVKLQQMNVNECDKSNGTVTIPKFEVYETWYTPRWDVHYPQSVGEWDSLDRSHQRWCRFVLGKTGALRESKYDYNAYSSMNCMSFFCFKVVLMMVAECRAIHSLWRIPTKIVPPVPKATARDRTPLVGSSGIGAKPPSQPTGDGDYDYGIGFIYHHKKK